MPETYFAPAAKADSQTLQSDIDLVSKHPIIDALLHSVSGLLAILNEERQIISANDTLLAALGIKDHKELLALRPGEALNCIHAFEAPNGCGTTKFCSSCGAAIAIVSCLDKDIPCERICALTAKRGGKTVEICLAVRAQPLKIEGRRYLMLFLLDITKEQFLLSLERTFFHDLNNILGGLLGTCQLYALQHNNPPEMQTIINQVLRISQEIAIQRSLSHFGEAGLKPIRQVISTDQIIAEIKGLFANHPAALDKSVRAINNAPGLSLSTDMALLTRVLCNMVTNALEATEARGEVRLVIDRHDRQGGGVSIRVWNNMAMPPEVMLRVFQRHFSTKEGAGRGLGTYSMKIFGEQYLGGEVSFTSSEEGGTMFCLTL